MTIKLLITGPFDSPIAPAMLTPAEFAAVLAEHDISVVSDAAKADLELCGWLWHQLGCMHLPRNRVIVVDGEPPQPEYLLPHYTERGFAAIVTPVSGAYAADCMAFYEPPPTTRPRPSWRYGRVVQLATYRTRPGPIRVSVNGAAPAQYRVLCDLRVKVGLALHQLLPGMVDLYGRGWPPGVVVGNDRGRPDFLSSRHHISAKYAFDLCWENTEIHGYVSEKFWSPVRVGTLPVYWGPENFCLPPNTIVDCRSYLRSDGATFDVVQLAYDVTHMDHAEYCRRVSTLLDWYYALPTDSHRQSVTKAAHHLANVIKEAVTCRD